MTTLIMNKDRPDAPYASLIALLDMAARHVPLNAMEYSKGEYGDRIYVHDAIQAAIAKMTAPCRSRELSDAQHCNTFARRANSALSAYIVDNGWEDEFDDVTVLEFLLTDLRHLCDAQGWGWAAADEAAQRAYLDDHVNYAIANANFADEAAL